MDVWVVLAIVKNAALNVNRVVQLFVRVPVFSASGYIPRNRIGGAVLVVLSCSAVSDSLAHEMWYLKACHVVVGGGLFAKSWPTFVTPWTAARQVPLSWGFSGENPGVGCNFLLQGIFPTKGLNPCLLYLLHCRWILYLLSHLDHMAILCLLFFFEEPTYSFPQWLYHFNSSNSKGSYYWSKGSLTFSCFFFFFFNTQPSGCKTIKNHHSLSSFITKQCASQTSMLYPWLLLSLSLSSPPYGCCIHEIVTQETRPCCLVFFPIFYYENVQIQQSWRHC